MSDIENNAIPNILSEKLALLPQAPGVYKMFDSQGTVIYVGKAKSLRNRVRQYFHTHNAPDRNDAKVRAMVSHVADFEYIVTKNETEALTLEASLIKRLQPRYNILLKDDKHFPYLRVDIKQDFPRFEVVRRVSKDGAVYCGPYLSSMALRSAMDAIREYFPARHCKKDISKSISRRERPCLMYHINKCCAPCSGNVTREEYHKLTNSVCDFLNGNTSGIVQQLTKDMNAAATDMDFEKAAMLRDRIRAIEQLGEKQRVSNIKTGAQDVFAVSSDETEALVFALFVRNGNVIGTEKFIMSAAGCGDDEIMAGFIKQYYAEAAEIPREVLLCNQPPESEGIELWLRYISGHAVSMLYPQKGKKRDLCDMAHNNAIMELEKRRALQKREWDRGYGALTELSGIIGLDCVPSRIECYDNSHTQGRDTVAAMIVFTDGKPQRSEYRRFRIKANTDGDDYMAMEEVVTRRLERAKNGDGNFSQLPELIIADGGRGQLNAVLKSLEKFGLADQIPVIGLAERNEEIVTERSKQNIVLEKNSAALHILQRIRDEAHRFAITYHRNLRNKSVLYSVLDSVDGVGERRKRALFDAFITMDAMKQASVDDIAAVNGITRPVAQRIYELFHNSEDKTT